jgi:predicted ATPase
MVAINEFYHDQKFVPLSNSKHQNHNHNVFTIVVGKNGVGKSRLLANIANESLSKNKYAYLNKEYVGNTDDVERVIAISTSPFDKFKLPPKKNYKYEIPPLDAEYKYVGMRSGVGTSSTSLIASATKGILESYIRKDDSNRLKGVFDTLGFATDIRLILKPIFSLLKFQNFVETPLKVRTKIEETLGIDVPVRNLNELNTLKPYEIDELRIALNITENLFYKNEKNIFIELDLTQRKNKSELTSFISDTEVLQAVNTLLNYNLIRLLDLKLYKLDFGSISLRRASSGEQCLLVIMLGIAGNIRDNSIVLIDEPEISLHPSWQENFMPLLIESFSNYKACHFIIATHSPQITSGLDSTNCFVTSLTKNEIYEASCFRQKSSDFQLAELFGAPGRMNEYISRVAFSLLSQINASKCVTEIEQCELDKLIELSTNISKDDPVNELIRTVKEVVKFYAFNK